MKKIKVFLAFVSTVLLCFLFTRAPKEAVAYDSSMLDPTIPAGYYDKVDLSKNPDDIKLDLGKIISTGFVHHSYKANNEVLKNTDPDPNKKGSIICFYTGQSLSGGWNKEHVWAKSHGFPQESYYPYCDAHHLRPTLNSINSSRGNSDFGEVTGGKSDSFGNKWTSDTFEPRDEVKGDVARIMFYMETMYGQNTQFKLKLVDDAHTKASNLNGRFGNLQTLIKWNYEDPVSPEEIYRNNVIYKDYQHNRNPYIDHPEYVDYVYPSEYSTNTEPDQAKVDAVIAKIKALPTTITLEDETAVNLAKAAYDALNFKEKKLVTNANVLTAALDRIAELKGDTPDPSPTPNPNPTPDPTLDGEKVDFTKYTTQTNYCYNKSLTIDSKPFLFSAMGVYDGEFRLGHNKSATVPSVFGLGDAKGSSLEMAYDVKGATGVQISWGKNYLADDYYIFFSSDGGTTYTKVAEGVVTENSKATAVLSEASTGRFAFVIVGTANKPPRLALESLTVSTGEVKPDDTFTVNASYSSSISIDYNSEKMIGAYVRFGVTLSDIDETAKYSIFGYNTDSITGSLKNQLNGETSIEEFAQNVEDLDVVEFDITDDLIQTSNGYFYKDMIEFMDFYDYPYTIVIVCEKDGKLYFSESCEFDFMEEYEALVAAGTLSETQAAIIKATLDKYFEE